jgi:ubiquinone/menaquinone biosynthesis C-methylase UbiE
MGPATDPNAYLRAFHDQHPGQSPLHFGRGVTEEGGSSYEAIVRRVDRARCVLDLGCGDGFLLERIAAATGNRSTLIGVDMSTGELGRAAERTALRGAELLAARAQELPIQTNRCDLVVSHMAFMLMSEMEQVVCEIARVLVPGGRFVTAVGGGPAGEDAFAVFVSLLHALPRTEDERAPRIGDRRARTEEGMRALFSTAAGFERVEMTALTLRTDGPTEEVFASLMGMYGLELLTDAHRATLHEQFAATTRPLLRPDGTLPCTEWLRIFTMVRK